MPIPLLVLLLAFFQIATTDMAKLSTELLCDPKPASLAVEGLFTIDARGSPEFHRGFSSHPAVASVHYINDPLQVPLPLH